MLLLLTVLEYLNDDNSTAQMTITQKTKHNKNQLRKKKKKKINTPKFSVKKQASRNKKLTMQKVNFIHGKALK